MSLNSSSISNSSHPSPPSYSISIYCYLHSCLNSSDGAFSITAFTVTSYFFLLPLYILVLYLGFQRWRQQRLGRTTNLSDFLTYNMVCLELLSVIGFTFLCFGFYTDLESLMMVGTFLSVINLNGQMLIHILTCVERYLAVVHPVTYMIRKKAKGIRIRNITTGFVWLNCSLSGASMQQEFNMSAVFIIFCCISFSFFVISFCSLSVLRVLIRPVPGDGGGDRQLVDQSKLRAFYTIMAILAVLLLRLGGFVLTTALYMSQLGEAEKCGGWLGLVWFSLPSSLVLPLLFLQRAGKLVCCKKNNKSGQE